MTTPAAAPTMYLVIAYEEGTYDIADSLEAAKQVASERVQDYFGRPIEWRQVGGAPVPSWEGRYHVHVSPTGVVLIEERPVHTATGADSDSAE